MKIKLGCLHAHFSNIEYIEKAFAPYDMELIHFVDPALIYRVTSDRSFKTADARNKVKEQIEWIAQCNVDAILVTCTNYIAILSEEQLSISVPIIKIDEPFFESVCKVKRAQTIVFTNPATVKGTLERLNQYAHNHQKSIDIEAKVINNTFELIMQGRKHEYNHEISKFLQGIILEDKIISVAQLSMVQASKEIKHTTKTIINPLDTLVSSVVKQLKLE
ncbi:MULTISPECIES: hypothetical protein [Bacillus]|uniref:hypothetical protein n=1 Tax=Bacillus TaxID=1386 RepID=UPI000C786E98|nr:MULTISPECIES: hypothetical protein [Bacillus]MCA1033192.1 hypothetical protein [Bacillus infantis]MCK6206577.1 hypothetical protein [Bacillus infantis]PLR73258.1 hypothetical protein CYJ37_06825 [Bacillus sp. UMB0728]